MVPRAEYYLIRTGLLPSLCSGKEKKCGVFSANQEVLSGMIPTRFCLMNLAMLFAGIQRVTLRISPPGIFLSAKGAGAYQPGATPQDLRIAKRHRAEHPDYEPDLNFKKAKTEATGGQ